MRRQDIISIIVTFVVGMAAGAYLYLFGFSQQFSLDTIDTGLAPARATLTLTIDAYGGCDRTGRCPRYVVSGAGVVVGSVPRTPAANEVTGQLDDQLWREIVEYFSAERLAALAETVTPMSACPSWTDGLDYRVALTRTGTTYVLDTCTSALAEDQIGNALVRDIIDHITL